MKLLRLAVALCCAVSAFAQTTVTVGPAPTRRLQPTIPWITFPPVGLRLDDTDASHQLIFTNGSNLTANRTFTLKTGDTDLEVDFSGAVSGNSLSFNGTKWVPVPAPVAGTVTAFSFTNANGFLGTVATSTSTPALSLALTTYASVAAVKAITVTSLTSGTFINLGGYLTNGDGAEGLFYYDSTSSATNNNGTVIQPTAGSGRWLRLYSGGVNVRWFGALGNWNGTTGQDDTTYIQAAITAVGGGAYRGEIYIPAGVYKITASLTLGAGGDVSKPVIIRGDGQATQIVNVATASKPTWSFKGISFWILKDMLLTGNSTNPNDGVLIAKDGSGNQCARFTIDNVIAEMAGRGFVLQDTNTGVLRDCKSWPSSNSSGATVPPVVTASDISHGIYMTGDFVNNISIYDFDCQPATTYAAGMSSIKADATASLGIRIQGGLMEGGSVGVPGSGRYSLNLANVEFSTISSPYCENSDITLSACRYMTLDQVDQASGGTLLITGNSVQNLITGGYYGTLQINAGSNNNSLVSTAVYTLLTDNGTDTLFWHVGGNLDRAEKTGRAMSVGGAFTGSSTGQFTSTFSLGSTAPVSQYGFLMSNSLSGATTQRGLSIDPVFGSGATAAASAIWARYDSAAASYTTASGATVEIAAPSVGAGNTVTNLYGLLVNDISGGGTNYAIYTGAGAVRFGGTVTGTAGIATTTLSATGAIDASGTVNVPSNAHMQLGASATSGGVIIGQGTTNDVVLLNKSGSIALKIPTGTTGVTVTDNLTASGMATTTLSASGQITSSLAAGTPPLVIASTTNVPNLYVARATLADSTSLNATITLSGAVTGSGTGAISTTYSGTQGVATGGTGLTSGTSGGILAYTGTTTLSSSGALTAGAIVVGGGAGAVPTASTMTISSGTLNVPTAVVVPTVILSGAMNSNTAIVGGATSLLLGTAGSAAGSVGFRNATSGTATLAPPTGALGTYQVTLPNGASTLPIYPQQLTYTGPTAARTITVPDANFTEARTDAAQTFTGVQSMTSPDITTSLTSPSTTFALLNVTPTTINAFGAATTVNTGASATQIWNFGGSTTASQFRFLEPSGSGTNFSSFKAVAQSADINYSLPPTVGAAGTVLTDAAGNGVLTWAAAAGGAAVANPGSQVLGLTAINGVAVTAMRSDGAPALDVTIAPIWSGAHIHSVAGAASVPAIKLSGVPFAGTGTTSFPLLYINDASATASTTLNTAGTYLGVNGDGTQDLINLLKDGTSQFNVSSAGLVSAVGTITSTAGGVAVSGGGSYYTSGRGYIVYDSDGVLRFVNNGTTGFTRLDLGGNTNSAVAIGFDAVNGLTFQSAAGTATWNDSSTAGSGTVANRYLVGIAAPTLTATNASVTYTVASTVYIGGAPTASTNTTIGTANALLVAGNIVSNSATAGVGYAAGSGGTVTQATSRTTGVTLSKVTGTITTDTTSLAALASASFTVTNTAVAINDVIVLSIRSGQTNKQTMIYVSAVAAGSFEITVNNEAAVTAETGAIVINYVIIKGQTS